MSRDDLHFRLRIPQDLKAKIETAAVENHRSMTAEIVARVEQSFEVAAELENDAGDNVAESLNNQAEIIRLLKHQMRLLQANLEFDVVEDDSTLKKN